MLFIMDNRTIYSRASKMLNLIPDKIIHLETLKSYIRREMASNPKTIDSILRIMADAGLIKETGTAFKYEIIKNGIGNQKL